MCVTLLALVAGCGKNSNIVGAAVASGIGAAAGHGIGESIAGDNPDDTSIDEFGAPIGAAIGAAYYFTSTRDKQVAEAKEEGKTEGYILGQSDSTKRHYWMMQRLHEGSRNNLGETKVIEVDVPEMTTQDGRHLEPRTVRIPVVD